MNKEVADKWIEALRSGKYKQGKQQLCKVNGKTAKYCCLGVLCHILGTPYTKSRFGNKEYDGRGYELSSKIKEEVGMKTVDGRFYEGCKMVDSLASLNDSGKSFKYISNIIEKNWEQL